MNDDLLAAIAARDKATALALIEAGADLSGHDKTGETILSNAIFLTEDPQDRLELVRALLAHGADPRLLNVDGTGPLLECINYNDDRVMRLLLEAGADPNVILDGEEPLYDYTQCDYEYESYGGSLPERGTEADRATVESWIDFLDRLALKHERPRPTMLYLLREFGARSWSEEESPE